MTEPLGTEQSDTMDTAREHADISGLQAEIAGLREEIDRHRDRERDLEESRRAMLYMLEDLNESTANIDRARKEWETTFDGITGPVCIHDAELKVMRANRAFVREAGIPLDAILGRPYFEVFPFTQRPFRACQEAMVRGCEKEERVSTVSGRIFNVHIYPIRDDEGKYLFSVHIMEDITERTKAEEEKAKLEAQLRHAQKMEAIGTLAGGIAHDFNNLLNVIMGYGTLVRDGLVAGSPLQGQMAEVLTAAERAALLTKRLLTFSRKQVVDVAPVDINDLIRGLEKMLVRLIGEDIDVGLDLAEGPLTVMADAGQIEQVLINLATNARDAMPLGGRFTIATREEEMDEDLVAALGYGRPGSYALITAADTGQGMDRETQLKVFEPFFTTKGIGEGTGLGLAISYRIVKQHNGYIRVDSEPGSGSLFQVYLPLVRGPVPQRAAAEPAADVRGGRETVLVAEDDASVRKLMVIVLESFGYQVIAAEDGDDALAKFTANRDAVALAILDIIMPRKGGREVCEAMRELNPGVKILFASGYTSDTVKAGGLIEAGFDFINKPVLPKDLLKKVREVLDR